MAQAREADLAAGAAGPQRVDGEDGRGFTLDAAVARQATSAERQRLLSLREDGTIGDAAFQRVEQELDLEELALQRLAPGDGPGNA